MTKRPQVHDYLVYKIILSAVGLVEHFGKDGTQSMLT
jgi:hypothetical protein